MSDLENFIQSVEIRQTREESKKLMRQMKINGMTKNEIEAVYAGAICKDESYRTLLPLMFLWIDEVYKEENENEST